MNWSALSEERKLTHREDTNSAIYRSTGNRSGQLTEAWCFGRGVETLLWLISPAICQTLVMIEKYEKAKRMRVMLESGGEAAIKMGKASLFPLI